MTTKASSSRIPPQRLAPDEDLLQAQLDRLEEEFQVLRRQVRRAQRLASLGTGAAALAHEFNNVLTPIVGYCRAALDSDDSSLMKKALERSLKQAKLLSGMCDRILRLAADEPIERKAVGVLHLAEEAVASLGRDLSEDNISLSLQIDPQLKVLVDEREILQVLLNLIINARQAMLGRPGKLIIDAARAPACPQRVVICVRDSGPGIKPEDLPHIFEPGFSTKQHADRLDRGGIGLGLSVSREIAEENEGSLTVENAPAAGATFILTLPAAS
jgi:signal transduction histidine kinase